MKYFIIIISILTLNNHLTFALHENDNEIPEESSSKEEGKVTSNSNTEESATKTDETKETYTSKSISTANEQATAEPSSEKTGDVTPTVASLEKVRSSEPSTTTPTSSSLVDSLDKKPLEAKSVNEVQETGTNTNTPERSSNSESIGDPMNPDQAKGDLSGVTAQETLHLRKLDAMNSRIPTSIGPFNAETGTFSMQFKGVKLEGTRVTGAAADSAIAKAKAVKPGDATTAVDMVGGPDSKGKILVFDLNRPLQLAEEGAGIQPNSKDGKLAYSVIDLETQRSINRTGTASIPQVLVWCPEYDEKSSPEMQNCSTIGGGGAMGQPPE